MKILVSNYHETKNHEFKMEIISETKEELELLLLPEYRDKFENGHKPFKLRKSLIPSLYHYETIDYIQDTLF